MFRRQLSALPLVVLLLVSLPSLGCNGPDTAVKAQNVITAIIAVAKAEAPVVPTADQAAYTNFVNLAITLDGQLASCNAGVSGMTGKGAQFAACFTAFAAGLTSPTELAELRILSPATQAKVQLYVTGIIAGINVGLAFFSKTAITPPVIGVAPTTSQLLQLQHQVGY